MDTIQMAFDATVIFYGAGVAGFIFGLVFAAVLNKSGEQP